MNELLQHLIKLQSLETGGTESKSVAVAKSELRGKIPAANSGPLRPVCRPWKKGAGGGFPEPGLQRVPYAGAARRHHDAQARRRHPALRKLRTVYLSAACRGTGNCGAAPAAPKPVKKTRKPRKTAKRLERTDSGRSQGSRKTAISENFLLAKPRPVFRCCRALCSRAHTPPSSLRSKTARSTLPRSNVSSRCRSGAAWTASFPSAPPGNRPQWIARSIWTSSRAR